MPTVADPRERKAALGGVKTVSIYWLSTYCVPGPEFLAIAEQRWISLTLLPGEPEPERKPGGSHGHLGS